MTVFTILIPLPHFTWLTDPSTVSYEQRLSANKAMVNGVSIADLDKTVAVCKKLIQWRVDKTVALIRESIGAGTSSQRLSGSVTGRKADRRCVGRIPAREHSSPSAGRRGPVWSADGRELFFRGGDELRIVDIELELELKWSKPRTLFAGQFTIRLQDVA